MRKAFTLIELLMAIALIALLAGLLLSALASARAAAERSVCASALREVGVAALVSTSENRGRIPATNWDHQIWAGTLDPYIDGGVSWSGSSIPPASIAPILRRCPARRRQGVSTSWPFHLGSVPYVTWQEGGWNYLINVWQDPGSWRRPKQLRMAQLTHLAGRVWLGESNAWWTPESYDVGWVPSLRRHRGSANELCFDGHVTALRPSQYLTALSAPWKGAAT